MDDKMLTWLMITLCYVGLIGLAMATMAASIRLAEDIACLDQRLHEVEGAIEGGLDLTYGDVCQ